MTECNSMKKTTWRMIGAALLVLGTAVYILVLAFGNSAKKPRPAATEPLLTSTYHMVLSKDEVGNRSVFVVGDVHGCYDEMCDLMKLAEQEDQNVLFLLVGDLVSKGPKPLEVLQRLRQLKADRRVYAVRGNHDDSCIREIQNFRADEKYEVPKKFSWIRQLESKDADFLLDLPYSISIPSLQALVVHAGLLPGIPLHRQDLLTLNSIRSIQPKTGDEEKLVGSKYIEEGEAWVKFWHGPEHVYFGHDAVRHLQLEPYATGLDTGCVYGRQLTGVFINGCKKMLSVNARETL